VVYTPIAAAVSFGPEMRCAGTLSDGVGTGVATPASQGWLILENVGDIDFGWIAA
jgi:hypothetical protein